MMNAKCFLHPACQRQSPQVHALLAELRGDVCIQDGNGFSFRCKYQAFWCCKQGLWLMQGDWNFPKKGFVKLLAKKAAHGFPAILMIAVIMRAAEMRELFPGIEKAIDAG